MKCSLPILCIFLIWISDSKGQIRSGTSRSGQLFRGFYNIGNILSIRRPNVPNIRFAVGRQAFTARQRPIIIPSITQRPQAAVSPSVNVASWTARPRVLTQPIRVIPYSTRRSYFVTSAPQLSPILNIPSLPLVTSQTPVIFGLSTAQRAQSVFQVPLAPVNIPFVSSPSVVSDLPVPPENVLVMPPGQVPPNTQQNGISGTRFPPVDTQSSAETSQSLVPDFPTRTDDTGGVDAILGNILSKIRQNSPSSQISRENTISRRSDNILRQGERFFKPLYKGHFRGERIVLARSIGTADRLQDNSTTGIHALSRSDIAGRLVGESNVDYRRRIMAKTRLPSADLTNPENRFFGLSERTGAARNLLDGSGRTETSQGGGVSQSSEIFPDDVLSNSVDERFREASSSQNFQETNSQLDKLSKFFPTDFGANSQHDRSQVIRIDEPRSQSEPNADAAFDVSSNLQTGTESTILRPDLHVAFPDETVLTNPSNAGSTASETDVIIAPVDGSSDITHEQTESPVADIVSDTHHFAKTDGFVPHDTSDPQHAGPSDIILHPHETNSHQMTSGLDASNTVEEPGLFDAAVNPSQESIAAIDASVPDMLAASATDPSMTEATLVHLPDIMRNSPPSLNEEMGMINTEPSPDFGMKTIQQGSTNTFDNERGVMQDFHVDSLGIDTISAKTAHDQGFQSSGQLETAWSTIDNRQTSRSVSETTGVVSLTCPTRTSNHGVCNDDFDCQRGYCYHRASKHGICCE